MLTTYPFHVDCVSLSRMTNHQLMLQCENQKDVLQVGRSAKMLPRRALVMRAIGAAVASESWCLIKHTRVHTGMCYSWKSRPSHLANGLHVLNVLGSKLWIEDFLLQNLATSRQLLLTLWQKRLLETKNGLVTVAVNAMWTCSTDAAGFTKYTSHWQISSDILFHTVALVPNRPTVGEFQSVKNRVALFLYSIHPSPCFGSSTRQVSHLSVPILLESGGIQFN